MPDSQFTFFIEEPLGELRAAAQRGFELAGAHTAVIAESADWVNSGDYVHDEAILLDAEELGDARAALIEDQIFSREEWLHDYVAAGWQEDEVLSAAVKYGWALAHLQSVIGDSPHSIVWSVADGSETTTPAELRFLLAELERRKLRVAWIAPCTPARFEPALDYAGDCAAFENWLTLLPGSEVIGWMFPNAEGKFSILPFIAKRTDMPIALCFQNVAWLEASRLVARLEPAVFRDLLSAAQERFVFDKGRHALATGEDDIRSLPGGKDAQLEATFLDDFRGRQLLHVTARSLAQDEKLAAQLTLFFAKHREEVERLTTAVVRRHLEALATA